MAILLAWRSIWRNRRRTLITTGSMALGLMVAIFFISFGHGMYSKMIDDGARLQAGHITVEHQDYRTAPAIDLFVPDAEEMAGKIRTGEQFEGLLNVKLLILGMGVAKTGSNSIGVAVMGVQPEAERLTSPLHEKIIKGEFLEEGDKNKVVVGSGLARRLKLDIGKKLVLTTNDADGNLVEALFRVKGIFETGVMEMDHYILQAPIGRIRELYVMPQGSATQIGVLLEDVRLVGPMLEKVSAVSGDSVARPWNEVMPAIASYIAMDRSSNIVFQTILILLVMFTTFNTQLMSVVERKREFASLMAIGTPRKLLVGQVTVEAFFIGLLGCMFGALLGMGITAWAGHAGIDLSSMMGETSDVSGFAISTIIFPEYTAAIVFVPCVLVFAVTMLFSRFVTRGVKEDDLGDVLRHE